MIASASMNMMIWISLMIAPPKLCGVLAISCGKEWYSRPQIIIARFCSTMDTPMAVMRGARRGA